MRWKDIEIIVDNHDELLASLSELIRYATHLERWYEDYNNYEPGSKRDPRLDRAEAIIQKIAKEQDDD